jgi:AraC-like DNA-binding protein
MITGMIGYRELAPGDWRQQETASLVVPLIISFGSPFLIALNGEPGNDDGQPSFAAGLHPGPVRIRSDGRAECVQVDFSPLGAFSFFGGATAHLTSRMIDIADVLGADGLNLRDRLGDHADWECRLDIVEEFLLARNRHRPSAELVFAYKRLVRSAGTERVAELAESIGCSRKHLTARFRAQLGVGPKTIARVMRFQRACRLARAGDSWAAVAADSGYADQAHLTREFAALAGESPSAWARRIALTDPQLLRDP